MEEDDGEGEWKPAKKGAALAVVSKYNYQQLTQIGFVT